MSHIGAPNEPSTSIEWVTRRRPASSEAEYLGTRQTEVAHTRSKTPGAALAFTPSDKTLSSQVSILRPRPRVLLRLWLQEDPSGSDLKFVLAQGRKRLEISAICNNGNVSPTLLFITRGFGLGIL